MPVYGPASVVPPTKHAPVGGSGPASGGQSFTPIVSVVGSQDSVQNNATPYLGLLIYDIEGNPQGNENTAFKYDAQTAPDTADFQALALANQHTGVSNITTGSWNVTAGGGMSVNVASGSGKVNNVVVSTANPTNLTIQASTQADRKDIIVYDTFQGGLVVVRGSECAGPTTAVWTRTAASPYPPVKPFLTNTQVLLAEVYVAYNLTAVTPSEIVDKRVATT